MKKDTNYENETPRTILALIDAHNELHITQTKSESEEVVGSYIDDV